MGAVLVPDIFLFVGLGVAFVGGDELIEIKLWLSQHPNVVIALIVALTVALIAAMAFHYDLSWIPGMLVRAIWSGN